MLYQIIKWDMFWRMFKEWQPTKKQMIIFAKG